MKHSVKALDVCIGPSLRWKDEFEQAIQKMKRLIKKSIVVDMKLHQVHFHFGTYMLTNDFLDVELLVLLKKNVMILRKM